MRASSTHKGSSYSSVAALPSVTGASAEAHVTNASGIYRGLKNKKASCLTDGIIYLIQQGADPLAEDDSFRHRLPDASRRRNIFRLIPRRSMELRSRTLWL